MDPDLIRRLGRTLALARRDRDSMTPEDAARAAHTPGGPSVEEIADIIRRHRAEARAAQRTAA
ncbi:hypothetical protein F4561_006601 [Lipingzhangella halophila]|uniref:Uncharacterized protein n=1 Tax=Lipingzhangella halophila TaxID=1783352 RepID=A0A7W7RPU8_9ACTN|nr:hypothetical protein [Lipingzhangella halophila]MBB4935692.1 hypothetical protein [Lipingzhangella halophila]